MFYKRVSIPFEDMNKSVIFQDHVLHVDIDF